MKGLELLFSSLVSLGTILVFFGTIGLISKNSVSYASIINIHEYLYNKCIAVVEYTDVFNISKKGLLEIDCPINKTEYNRIIPVSYSVLNSDIISEEQPFIKFDDALFIYRCGLVVIFASLPFWIRLKYYNKNDEDKEQFYSHISK